jgi:hypothetical protein
MVKVGFEARVPDAAAGMNVCIIMMLPKTDRSN